MKPVDIHNEPDAALAVVLGAILLPALGIVPLLVAPEINRYTIALAIAFCGAGALATIYALLRIPKQMVVGKNIQVYYFIGKRTVEWNELSMLNVYTRSIKSRGAFGSLLTTSEVLFEITLRTGGQIRIGLDDSRLAELNTFAVAHHLPLAIQQPPEPDDE